jgi:4-amino-4-deoxy-L-arabinose transferase-like glycosyltransferase
MSASVRQWVALAALLAVAGGFYVWRLADAPVYLGHDEVQFALNAHAIATTGADMEGRVLPLFFRDRAFPYYGRDPLNIYWTAVFLQVIPLSETTIRLASVSVGLLNIALVFVIARRLFGRLSLALGAAAFTAFAPAHIFYSRVAIEVVYPIPFVLAWLYLLLEFERHERGQTLLAGAFALGLSVYGHKSAEIVAPPYLLLTCIAAWVWTEDRRLRIRHLLLAVGGFSVALVPFALGLLRHPERYSGVVRAYGVYDSKLTMLQGMRDIVRYNSVGERIGAYWETLSPRYLFFFGDPSISDSNRLAGMFLLPTAVLLAVGLYAMAKQRSRSDMILVGGFFMASVAAFVDPTLAARRFIFNVPFAALIAMRGCVFLAHWTAGRIVVAAVAVLSAVHFYVYFADYLTTYREQSAIWFENNMRGMFERLVALDEERGGGGRIVVHIDNPYAADYGQFYAIKLGRPAFVSRVEYRETREADLQTGTTIVVRQIEQGNAPCQKPPGPLREVARIHNEGGTEVFAICVVQ